MHTCVCVTAAAAAWFQNCPPPSPPLTNQPPVLPASHVPPCSVPAAAASWAPANASAPRVAATRLAAAAPVSGEVGAGGRGWRACRAERAGRLDEVSSMPSCFYLITITSVFGEMSACTEEAAWELTGCRCRCRYQPGDVCVAAPCSARWAGLGLLCTAATSSSALCPSQLQPPTCLCPQTSDVSLGFTCHLCPAHPPPRSLHLLRCQLHRWPLLGQAAAAAPVSTPVAALAAPPPAPALAALAFPCTALRRQSRTMVRWQAGSWGNCPVDFSSEAVAQGRRGSGRAAAWAAAVTVHSARRRDRPSRAPAADAPAAPASHPRPTACRRAFLQRQPPTHPPTKRPPITLCRRLPGW